MTSPSFSAAMGPRADLLDVQVIVGGEEHLEDASALGREAPRVAFQLGEDFD